jgi:hypothetical protein
MLFKEYFIKFLNATQISNKINNEILTNKKTTFQSLMDRMA